MTDPRTIPKESIRALRGYEEEAHGGLNLSNNANLFGPNPALAKTLAALRVEEVWDYPSLTSAGLREAIGAKHGVPADSVITGNGSNDLIDVIIRAYADAGSPVAYHPPTFAMIPIFARTNAVEARAVPLREGYALDVDGMLAAKGRVTFIVSPNNPTGNAFAKRDILRVVEGAHGVVVVDEAYVEFGGDSVVPEVSSHPNLVVLRTFSKAYGLAGLRAGYAIAHPAIAQSAAKVRGPFRLNFVSERAATAALAEDAWLARVVADARRERARLTDALAARGFGVHPSDANFVLARVPGPLDGRALADRLRARDVWIRDFGGDLSQDVRITVGPAPMMDAFLEHLDRVLKEAGA